MKAVSIQNLTKYYKNFKALDNVSFEVEEGEFFGFLGPNGAGKTTTISVLTGLANYKTGSVKVFGYDVLREYRETRGRIGLVPQEFNFDPFLSAEQILTFEGGYFGMLRKDARKRAHELLETFGLFGKRRDGYKKLSGGMKRRLLIARALMHSPKVLILDEPTAGVDLELRYQLWDFLRKLNKEQGVTIFLTTHYIEEAEQLCERIGVIHEGRIVAQAPTSELIRKMHSDEVELHLEDEMKELPEGLNAELFHLEAGNRVLRFNETPDTLNRVLGVLHEKGIRLTRFETKRAKLEDAFLKLIGKKEGKAMS